MNARLPFAKAEANTVGGATRPSSSYSQRQAAPVTFLEDLSDACVMECGESMKDEL